MQEEETRSGILLSSKIRNTHGFQILSIVNMVPVVRMGRMRGVKDV